MDHRIAFLLLLLFAAYASAAESTFWGDLKPGSHSVGFQVIEKFDHGRPYKRKLDYEGKINSADRSRPLQINVWYPAKTAQGSPMLLRDYVHIAAAEDLVALTPEAKEQSEQRFIKSRWFQGAPEENVKQVLSKPVTALRQAPNADGKFPLIVIANSGGLSSPFSHFILAEYLASHGFIVASVPSRGAQSKTLDSRESTILMQDLQFLIGSLHDFPTRDKDRLGIVGFGVGSLGASLIAMHNTDVDAFVSLDGTIGNRWGYSLIFQNSLYKPNQLTVPVLHITNQETTPDTDLTFFRASKFAPVQYVRLKGLAAADFSSFGMIKSQIGLPQPKEGTLPDFKRGYESLVTYVHHFLNANVRQDGESKAFLQRTASTSELVTMENKPAVKVPPTEEQFVQIVREKGTEKALEIQKEYSQLVPDYRLYDPDVLFPLASEYAQAKKIDEAVSVLNLCTQAFPDNWECYDQIGRIYMDSGNKQLAIENLNKSIELNPDNPETAEMLKKLKES